MPLKFIDRSILSVASVALTASIVQSIAQPAYAFSVFSTQADYDAALNTARLRTALSDPFDNKIDGDSTITFDSGVTSTLQNYGGGNDNRVGSKEYFGSAGRASGRETTWDFPFAINAFSFDIQGSNSGLAIKGLFDGSDQGSKTVVFDTVGDPNSGYKFFGLIGDSTFNSFTFFDSTITTKPNPNDFNFKVDDLTAAVPTPALLPGLIGMGVAAIRKRKQENTVENS